MDAGYGRLAREPSLTDRVLLHLLDSIASGRLRPGDRLPSERELGDMFGVSRTVVREAVRSLQAKGVVDVRSGRGATVVAVPATHLTETLKLFLTGARGSDAVAPEQISEIRAMLEVRIVELACDRTTDHELAAMGAAIEAMEADEDAQMASEHDVAFHRLIAVATHNPLFVILLDSVGDVLIEIRHRSLIIEGRKARAVEQHRQILEALMARDPRDAVAAMKNHLDDSRRFYVRPIK